MLRLSALVAASARNGKLRPPGDLTEAILADGKLNEHAELIVFGRWLRDDGKFVAIHLGGSSRPGMEAPEPIPIACMENL